MGATALKTKIRKQTNHAEVFVRVSVQTEKGRLVTFPSCVNPSLNFGMTRTCTGACGLISRNARTFSSSYTMLEGISLFMILSYLERKWRSENYTNKEKKHSKMIKQFRSLRVSPSLCVYINSDPIKTNIKSCVT